MSCHISVSDIHNKEAVKCMHAGERVLLRSRGRTVGAIVSAEELELLEEIERQEDEEDITAAEKARKRLASGESELISLEEVEKRLGLDKKS